MKIKPLFLVLMGLILTFQGCALEESEDALNVVKSSIATPPARITVNVMSGMTYDGSRWRCKSHDDSATLLITYDNARISKDYKEYTRNYYNEYFTITGWKSSDTCNDVEIWTVICSEYVLHAYPSRGCRSGCKDQDIEPSGSSPRKTDPCFPNIGE